MRHCEPSEFVRGHITSLCSSETENEDVKEDLPACGGILSVGQLDALTIRGPRARSC